MNLALPCLHLFEAFGLELLLVLCESVCDVPVYGCRGLNWFQIWDNDLFVKNIVGRRCHIDHEFPASDFVVKVVVSYTDMAYRAVLLCFSKDQVN